MIYLSKQVKFKKQSETINTIIKDKQILDKKKKIKFLMKAEADVTNDLIAHRQKYEQIKNYHLKKHNQLISKEKIAKELLLKTIIRKYRLQAIQNKQINDVFANSIKNYLNSWLQFNNFTFIQELGGLYIYRLVKKGVLRIQTLYLIRPERKKIIFKKLIKMWIRNRVFQYVMLSVKRKYKCQSNKKYLLSIYSTSVPYFQLSLELTQQEFKEKICVKNPQQNLMINLSKKEVMLLDKYLNNFQNAQKVKRYYNIYKFQIQVIKSMKNIVFFKCLTIRNIFQSVYSVEGYQNLCLQVLVYIKKEFRRIQNPGYLSFQNNLSNSQLKFHKKFQQQNQIQYCFYCQPYRSYDKRFMFSIKDDIILNGYQENFHQFFENFLQKYLIQLNVKKLNKEKGQSKDVSVNEGRGIKINKQTQVQVGQPRIVSVIDFNQNIRRIIKVQSFIRMSLNRKKLMDQLRFLKKKRLFQFKCKIISNIMISAFIKNQQVIFFVQCLSLSAQKRKKPNDNFLHYNKKYWDLVLPFLNSLQFLSIIKKYLIWEIQDDIDYQFQEIIRKQEEQELKINQMRPIKALNRLRRFFIRSSLKIKIRKNIYYIQKIQKQFGTFVLIIRKCPLLKNIANVYLYRLKRNQNTNTIKKIQRNKKQNNLLKIGINSFLSCKLIQENKSINYQPISMFLQNVLAFVKVNRLSLDQKIKKSNQINGKFIQNQFYITQKYFIIKPLHLQNVKGVYKFIERLSSISLCSEQIQNQINSLNSAKNHKQNLQSQLRKTLNPSRSIQNISKKSSSSIIFDKMYQQERLQQQDENLIFYSIYKDAKGLFYLQLFLIISTQQNYYFKSVHKQQISKKDIASSSWVFIYRLIAFWVKNSGWCIHYSQRIKTHGQKQILGYHHLLSNNLFKENIKQDQKQYQK